MGSDGNYLKFCLIDLYSCACPIVLRTLCIPLVALVRCKKGEIILTSVALPFIVLCPADILHSSRCTRRMQERGTKVSSYVD
jgi:hypothetical protein